MPMAKALKAVAPSAVPTRKSLPATYSQWDKAMREIPTRRLQALNDPVVQLLATVAGLSQQQIAAGISALNGELEER